MVEKRFKVTVRVAVKGDPTREAVEPLGSGRSLAGSRSSIVRLRVRQISDSRLCGERGVQKS